MEFSLFAINFTEATRITLAPLNVDVTVGENATMQCIASHDPTLDLTFIWSLNGFVIDFEKEHEHYERNVMVRYYRTLFNVWKPSLLCCEYLSFLCQFKSTTPRTSNRITIQIPYRHIDTCRQISEIRSLNCCKYFHTSDKSHSISENSW